jgi:hypothetical protein
VDVDKVHTTLPNLNENCLQCLDEYANGVEVATPLIPGFRKVYNCAMCRQRTYNSTHSPGQSGSIGDSDYMNDMKVTCCSCGGNGSGSSSSGFPTWAWILIAVVGGLIILGSLGYAATKRSGGSAGYKAAPSGGDVEMTEQSFFLF